MTKTTKINTGIYGLTYKGRTFEFENLGFTSDGDCLPGWIAYETFGDRREYLNDFATKRAAVADTVAAVDEGF